MNSDWLHRSGTGKASNAPSGRFSRKPRVSIPASLYTETTPGAFLAECLNACNNNNNIQQERQEQQANNNNNNHHHSNDKSKNNTRNTSGSIFSSRLKPYQNKSSRLDPANDLKPLPPTPQRAAGSSFLSGSAPASTKWTNAPGPVLGGMTTTVSPPVGGGGGGRQQQDDDEQPLAPPSTNKWWKGHISRRGATRLVLTILVAGAILILIGVCVHVAREPSINKAKARGYEAGAKNDEERRNRNKKSSSFSTPDKAKGTLEDVSTWYDTRDFNTTYTDEKVGGLPIIGLFSTYNDSTRPNRKVPLLRNKFPYGEKHINGVNLGGWLVLEPFITPSLFKDFSTEEEGVVDEWTLSRRVASDEMMQLLEEHYATFITEDDFKQIAQAGLDHVRIPYGYWGVDNYDGSSNDLYMANIGWKYLLRGIEYARKYGLRVNLDVYAIPGNNNGFSYSGPGDKVQWDASDGGYKWADVTLRLHEQMGNFFAQDRYRNVVTMYSLVKDPKMVALANNNDFVVEWTRKAYRRLREAGFKNHIVFGDGFKTPQYWKGKLPRNDYPDIILDMHQHLVFDANLIRLTHSGKIDFACNVWANQMRTASDPDLGHGAVIVGEWSQADTDCTPFLNNVGQGSRWMGTLNATEIEVLTPSCPGGQECDCETTLHPSNYPPPYKRFLKDFASAQMHAFSNGWGHFYWTWKTETEGASQWSLQRARNYDMIAKQPADVCTRIPNYFAMGLSETF